MVPNGYANLAGDDADADLMTAAWQSMWHNSCAIQFS
jgi:hypothetical protein